MLFFIKIVIEIIKYRVGDKRTIAQYIFNSTVIILGRAVIFG